MKYLITCNENSQYLLDQEVKSHSGLGSVTWLSETEGILETKLSNEKLIEVIRTTPIIFIRHLFPIMGLVEFDDAESIAKEIKLEQGKSFSLQIRSPQEYRKHSISVRNTLVDEFKAQGFTLNVKNPEQIVSLYFTDKEVYYGLGTAELQLSKWSAGMVHFSKDQSKISRAEFKLREVFESFDVPNVHGLAIDLGAAPGGWTQVLVEQGFSVIAIDPANLDPSVKANPKVTHFKGTSQDFIEQSSDIKFDLMVNDMKMSIKPSVAIFHALSTNLSSYGFGIITLKLPKEYNYSYIIEVLRDMRKLFTIREARQLFHNRHEITVLVSKK